MADWDITAKAGPPRDADRIRAYAADHPGATQADIARALGVDRRSVWAALRRRPRERVEDPAEHVLSVRLTALQWSRLERDAQRRGVSVADRVRAWIERL